MTCVWEPDTACLTDFWDTLDPDVQERSLMLATSSLQMLTNYRVGTCPITVRPCLADPYPCGHAWWPYLLNGQWYNGCPCDTHCDPAFEIELPGPVGWVESIQVSGNELDLDDWRLDDGYKLVWQGEGTSPIPLHQNLDAPLGATGTWAVTYSRSYQVPADGKLAVAYLAMEFAKACVPKTKCSLPRGVTNVVRNGVSFTIDAGLFPGGLTNIDVVDQFILKWAPAGSPTRTATVFDPSRRKSTFRRTSGVPRGSAFGSL